MQTDARYVCGMSNTTRRPYILLTYDNVSHMFSRYRMFAFAWRLGCNSMEHTALLDFIFAYGQLDLSV
jgi:hypothetical protein